MKKRRRREEADSISAVHPRCDTLMDPWCSASLLPVPWVLWVVGKHMHRFTLLPDSRRFFAPPWPLRAPSYVGQSFSLLFQSFTFLNVFLCVCWVLCSYSQISHCLSFSISSPPPPPPSFSPRTQWAGDNIILCVRLLRSEYTSGGRERSMGEISIWLLRCSVIYHRDTHTHTHTSISLVAGLDLAATHRFRLCAGLTSKCAFDHVCIFMCHV